nr:MAG TPA: hypothetical protein [Caudoviricetes sp.]
MRLCCAGVFFFPTPTKYSLCVPPCIHFGYTKDPFFDYSLISAQPYTRSIPALWKNCPCSATQ